MAEVKEHLPDPTCAASIAAVKATCYHNAETQLSPIRSAHASNAGRKAIIPDNARREETKANNPERNEESAWWTTATQSTRSGATWSCTKMMDGNESLEEPHTVPDHMV